MSNRLQSGVNTLPGFREDKRNRITPGTLLWWRHVGRELTSDLSVYTTGNLLSCVWNTFLSVLHELRAVHLLRSHLWLQLLQHQQGGFWPGLLSVWGGLQSAGPRQVCTVGPWAQLHLHKNVTWGILADYFPDVSLIHQVYSSTNVWLTPHNLLIWLYFNVLLVWIKYWVLINLHQDFLNK